MYSFIRFFISIIFFGILILLQKKFKSVSRRRYLIISTISSILFLFIITFIPFENTAFTFTSPEQAYNYYNSNGKIAEIIPGENCDFIIGNIDNKRNISCIPKTEDGWKIGIPLHTKKILVTANNGFTVIIYQYKNTTDYFIMVSDMNNTSVEISDSLDSQFVQTVFDTSDDNVKIYGYYAYIKGYNSDYELIINGTNIPLSSPYS